MVMEMVDGDVQERGESCNSSSFSPSLRNYISHTLPLCCSSGLLGRTVGRGTEMMLEGRRQAEVAPVAGLSRRDTQDADKVAPAPAFWCSQS
jgi:hypothetical protein